MVPKTPRTPPAGAGSSPLHGSHQPIAGRKRCLLHFAVPAGWFSFLLSCSAVLIWHFLVMVLE